MERYGHVAVIVSNTYYFSGSRDESAARGRTRLLRCTRRPPCVWWEQSYRGRATETRAATSPCVVRHTSVDSTLLDAATALVHHRRMPTPTLRARWAQLLLVIAM